MCVCVHGVCVCELSKFTSQMGLFIGLVVACTGRADMMLRTRHQERQRPISG